MHQRLVRSPAYSEADEAFIRATYQPVEDRPWTARPVGDGLRWFRSENIIPIEKYRRPVSTNGDEGPSSL